MFSKLPSVVQLISTAAAVVLLGWTSTAHAQVEDITFTRTSTTESMVSDLEFRFGVAVDAEEVSIDQLGVTADLIQNNDGIGQELFLEVMGGIDSIGEVGIGDILTAGTAFPETDFLDLGPAAAVGDDVFVGFNSGGNIGYFKISFDANIDSIIYSDGLYGSGGESLTVAAVPEPSSLLILMLAGVVAGTRRRCGHRS